MPESLLEYEQIKDKEIYYLNQISTSSKILYAILLTLVVVFIGSLPFINVTINTSSSAMIQTALTNETVSAPMAGKIAKLNFKDNWRVHAGDTLLLIDNSSSKSQIDVLHRQKASILDNLHDLGLLNESVSLRARPFFYSRRYEIEFDQLLTQRREILLRRDKISKDYERNRKLFSQKIISDSEWEVEQLKIEQITSELELLDERARVKFSSDEYNFEQELDNVNKQLIQLQDIHKQSVITANISGTIYKNSGVQEGSFLQGGQQVAEISPGTSLVAICYVTPKDIGLISLNQNVRFQMDAFNYIDWGMIKGKVIEIKDDIVIINNQPFFVVKCLLESEFLKLKNGRKGTIKKGMTSTANFDLMDRSLWQLIFDKMIDWLDPNSPKL